MERIDITYGVDTQIHYILLASGKSSFIKSCKVEVIFSKEAIISIQKKVHGTHDKEGEKYN